MTTTSRPGCLDRFVPAALAAPALALLALSCAPRPAGPASPPTPPAHAAASSSAAPATDPFAASEARARALVDVPAGPHGPPVLVQHATVLTATGKRYAPGFVLMAEGVIASVGEGDGVAPPGGVVVEAQGKFVTPGIIDPHSHIGVYPVPDTAAHDDGNELTDPITAGLRAEHSFWPEDPAIERAVAGGVTTIGVLPGSGNLVGGRGVVMHLFPQLGARAMRFPGAPDILKMACGENPKRVYGEMKRAPSTRMGNLRALREALVKAQKYARDWREWQESADKSAAASRDGGAGPVDASGAPGDASKDPAKLPDRDLALETLAQVMRGDILVEWHCYQADDMLAALQVADEFGFKVRAFHHALEAYKIRDVLARKGVGVATWDDWWGFKMEAYDGIPESLALLTEAGVRASVHSDSPIAIQVLNQAAGKALYAGRAAGIQVTEEDALRWLTINPAWALGIDDRTGSLEPGKHADVVVWSEDPFSTYARADRVFIDGQAVYDRARAGASWSDFELGVRPAPSGEAPRAPGPLGARPPTSRGSMDDGDGDR